MDNRLVNSHSPSSYHSLVLSDSASDRCVNSADGATPYQQLDEDLEHGTSVSSAHITHTEAQAFPSGGRKLDNALMDLAHGPTSGDHEEEGETEVLLKSGTGFAQAARREAFNIFMFAMPMTLVNLFETLPLYCNIVFVGHLDGNQYLDAAALATMYSNITGLSVGLGLNIALETFCSQAYGAKNYRMLGIYLQRALCLNVLACIPIFLINWFAEDILKGLGQDHEVSELAAVYIRYLLLGLPCIFLYDIVRRVLQCQGLLTPLITVAVTSNIVNVAVAYVLVFHTNLGYLGPAIAFAATSVLFPALILFYVWMGGLHRDWWHGFSRECFSGLREFVNVGFPAMVSYCLEWWAWEIVALLSGLLPDSRVTLAAFTVLFRTTAFVFMFYSGIAMAVSTLVGNALGRNQPKTARLIAFTSLLVGYCFVAFFTTLIITLRDYIPRLFTSDPDVISTASRFCFLLGAYQVLDGSNCICLGIFRGTALQTRGAIINIAGYYFVAIPVAAALAFPAGLNLLGLWLGLISGLSLVCILSFYTVITIDWAKQCALALERVSE